MLGEPVPRTPPSINLPVAGWGDRRLWAQSCACDCGWFGTACDKFVSFVDVTAVATTYGNVSVDLATAYNCELWAKGAVLVLGNQVAATRTITLPPPPQ